MHTLWRMEQSILQKLTQPMGSFVSISCDTGFEASGGSGTECLVSGNWSTAVSCVPKGMFGLSILILHFVSYCEGNNNGICHIFGRFMLAYQ